MKLTTGYKKPIASSGTDALELSSNNSYLLLAGGGHKALSELVSPADLTTELSNYVTIGSDQTITGIKTFSLAINADITGNADTVDGFHENSFSRHITGVTSPSNKGYYKIGSLPASTNTAYDAFLIQGEIGGWSSTYKIVLNVCVSRRDGVTFCGYTQGLWQSNYGIDIGINNAGEIVLIVTGDYASWTLDLHTIQGTIDYTGTAFTPTDTNFVLLSASNNVSKSLANGAVEKSTKWATARTLTLTGSVTGSVSIDGSSNVTLSTTTNHTHTKSQITDFPTSLPANGGNADTVGGTTVSHISVDNLSTGYWNNLGYLKTKNISLGSNYGGIKWRAEDYCADLMFGNELDTHGFLSIGFRTPIVSFSGSNSHNADNDNPNWYFKLKGTSGTTYDLNCVPAATKLQTARTIWGQSFDGTNNISGSLTGATTIEASTSVKIGNASISYVSTNECLKVNDGYNLNVNGVRLGRNVTGTSRAFLRLDPADDSPTDIVFGRDANASSSGWGNAYWVLSSRNDNENKVFGLWRAYGNSGTVSENFNSEQGAVVVFPNCNVKIGDDNSYFSTDRGYKLWVNGTLNTIGQIYQNGVPLGSFAFLNSISTSSVSEGNNLYFTNARAISACDGSYLPEPTKFGGEKETTSWRTFNTNTETGIGFKRNGASKGFVGAYDDCTYLCDYHSGSFKYLKLYPNGDITWGKNTIYHSGNLTADTIGALTTSTADTTYVKKVGDIMTGRLTITGSARSLLSIRSSSSYNAYYEVQFSDGTEAATFGHITNYSNANGLFITNTSVHKSILINDADAELYYCDDNLTNLNKIYHAGNSNKSDIDWTVKSLYANAASTINSGDNGTPLSIYSTASDVSYRVYKSNELKAAFGYYQGGAYMWNAVAKKNVHLSDSGHFITSGNVSVNAGENPTYALQVGGKVGVFSSVCNPVRLQSTNQECSIIFAPSDSTAQNGHYVVGAHTSGEYPAWFVYDTALNKQTLRVENGRCSINNGAVYPEYNLYVNGNFAGDGYRLGKSTVIGNRSCLLLNSDSSTPADIVFRSGSYTKGTWGDWALSSRGNENGNNNFYIARGGYNNGTAREDCIIQINHNGRVVIGQSVFNTSPSAQLHVAGDIYTTNGFKKEGSDNNYVLLGGGGHKSVSDFVLKSDHAGDMYETDDAGYADSGGNKVSDYCITLIDWLICPNPNFPNCTFADYIEVPIPSILAMDKLADCIRQMKDILLQVGEKIINSSYLWSQLHWLKQCSRTDCIVYTTKYAIIDAKFPSVVYSKTIQTPPTTIEISVSYNSTCTPVSRYVQVVIENMYGRAYYKGKDVKSK